MLLNHESYPIVAVQPKIMNPKNRPHFIFVVYIIFFNVSYFVASNCGMIRGN
jgi:hypothetical protein